MFFFFSLLLSFQPVPCISSSSGWGVPQAGQNPASPHRMTVIQISCNAPAINAFNCVLWFRHSVVCTFLGCVVGAHYTH